MAKYPFEATYDELKADLGHYVSGIFSLLESEVLVMPKGLGFVEYPVFERGYECLKKATAGFARMEVDAILTAVVSEPVALVVLRSVLGLTPPEWAYLTTERSGVTVTQGSARSLDRRVRLQPDKPLRCSEAQSVRLRALVSCACQLIKEGPAALGADQVHRLDKADTRDGSAGLPRCAQLGVPYTMLLYERFLGRPFAGHRDSVSEKVGDVLEAAVEDTLVRAGVSFRKTKRTERIEGLDQAPDFVVPSEFSPQVVIEAKVTQDDGTARDKVTRIQHLAEISAARPLSGKPGFEVIACIGGRGFGVRRRDMEEMLLATQGKVFTAGTLDRLVPCTRLDEFRTA